MGKLAYSSDTVHSKGNKFVTGVKIKAKVDSKLNDSLRVIFIGDAMY